MQRLIQTLTIALFIFATNANAEVLMDEVVSSDTVIHSPHQTNGFAYAVETKLYNPAVGTALITPLNSYDQTDNSIDPEAIIQEKVAASPSRNNETFLLWIAVVGLILFIVRRRSGD